MATVLVFIVFQKLQNSRGILSNLYLKSNAISCDWMGFESEYSNYNIYDSKMLS